MNGWSGGTDRIPDWHASALCAQTDPALFWPGVGESTAPAKRICRRCPVRESCLADALADAAADRLGYGRWGVRGGLSELERAAMVHERRGVA